MRRASSVRLTKSTPAEESRFQRSREARDRGEIDLPSTEKIDAYPDVLAVFVKRSIGLSPHEYAFSDETYLSNLETVDTDALFARVKRICGIDVPRGKDEPYLWQVIAEIATQKTRRTRTQ